MACTNSGALYGFGGRCEANEGDAFASPLRGGNGVGRRPSIWGGVAECAIIAPPTKPMSAAGMPMLMPNANPPSADCAYVGRSAKPPRSANARMYIAMPNSPWDLSQGPVVPMVAKRAIEPRGGNTSAPAARKDVGPKRFMISTPLWLRAGA